MIKQKSKSIFKNISFNNFNLKIDSLKTQVNPEINEKFNRA